LFERLTKLTSYKVDCASLQLALSFGIPAHKPEVCGSNPGGGNYFTYISFPAHIKWLSYFL